MKFLLTKCREPKNLLGCDIVYSDILNDVFKYGETHGRKPESLCYTQAKQLKKFYEDTNQTEKAYNCPEYLQNSFHCAVYEQISPFEKQDEEFDLFHMIEGKMTALVKPIELRETPY